MKNGVKQIHYPNGLQRIINTDGSEEVLMQDGTLLRIYSNGTESLEFPNGDREIRTHSYQVINGFKIRIIITIIIIFMIFREENMLMEQ